MAHLALLQHMRLRRRWCCRQGGVAAFLAAFNIEDNLMNNVHCGSPSDFGHKSSRVQSSLASAISLAMLGAMLEEPEGPLRITSVCSPYQVQLLVTHFFRGILSATRPNDWQTPKWPDCAKRVSGMQPQDQ